MFKYIHFLIGGMLLIIFTQPPIYAQDQDPIINLKAGPVYTPANQADFWKQYNTKPINPAEGPQYYLVQFYETPNQQLRQQAKNAGMELLEYLPKQAYYARLQPKAQVALLQQLKIRSIVPIKNEFKYAPSIAAGQFPEWAQTDDLTVELIVTYMPGEAPEKLMRQVQDRGGSIIAQNDYARTLTLNIPGDKLHLLAAIPAIQFIEAIPPPGVPENYTARTAHRSNQLFSDHLSGLQFDGRNVNIMLQDDGRIGPHIDYTGRIGAQNISYNLGNHGDHVAGTIMGAGNLDPEARGMAPGATLFVYGAAPTYPGFTAIPSHYFDPGIRITSTSYSNGCNAGYTSLARTMDQQINDFPSLTHVFSAGNSGTDNCGYGAGPGWGNITGGHKAAKNVLAVANLNLRDELANSSSRGPARDGRIKPDLAAKGTEVYSTINPHSYDFKTGTSMSCPGVTGTIAQLYQGYQSLNNNAHPKAALIKAIVLNTADDLGNPGPDYKFGWGRINARKAYQVIERLQYDSAVIDQNEQLQHQIEVPANTQELKLMVYWSDVAGTVSAAPALVNDLDIQLQTPAGSTYSPWVPNPFPHPDSLNQTARRGSDHLNNMEQITLNQPEAGSYILTVNGFNIPSGPQQYFINWYIPTDEITLTYPAGGESLIPGNTEIIRWDALGESGNFSLEYSLDEGTSWTLISANIDGADRHYQWHVTSAITGRALIRISRNNHSSVNPHPFSIIGKPGLLQVDWVCDNTYRISWEAVYGATEYEIMVLGNEYMETVAVSSSTAHLFSGIPAAEEQWVAVRALGPENAIGKRTHAIQKPGAVFGCHPQDAMMTDIPSASWGTYANCLNTTQLPVKVRFTNFGNTPLNNPTLAYQLDNRNPVSAQWNGELLPTETAEFIFQETIDIGAIGDYSLKAWIESSGDNNPQNDTAYALLSVIESTLIKPDASTQTFEDFPLCSSAPICEIISCPLGDGWLNLPNNSQDDIDWRVDKGGTSTSNTGPATDHTLGTATGHYLYLEPSVVCFNKEAILQLPCVDLLGTEQAALHFWYHARGADIGRLHVDIFYEGQLERDVMPPVIGQQGNEWHEATINLSAYAGKVIGIRLRGYTGYDQLGDLAIDDITITAQLGMPAPQPANKLLVNVFPNPGTGAFTLRVESGHTCSARLQLVDLTGRIVQEQSLNVKPGNNEFPLQMDQYQTGMYFLRMILKDQFQQVKIGKN